MQQSPFKGALLILDCYGTTARGPLIPCGIQNDYALSPLPAQCSYTLDALPLRLRRGDLELVSSWQLSVEVKLTWDGAKGCIHW
jgi:hypothetical protein